MNKKLFVLVILVFTFFISACGTTPGTSTNSKWNLKASTSLSPIADDYTFVQKNVNAARFVFTDISDRPDAGAFTGGLNIRWHNKNTNSAGALFLEIKLRDNVITAYAPEANGYTIGRVSLKDNRVNKITVEIINDVATIQIDDKVLKYEGIDSTSTRVWTNQGLKAKVEYYELQ